MSMMAVILLSATGAVLGLFLVISSIKFNVKKDPMLEQVEEALPGANCGACGKPGCFNMAEAMFKGEAEVDSCPPGGEETAQQIARILGKDSSEKKEKTTAYIRCKGMTDDIATKKFDFIGIGSCLMADRIGGGWKSCEFGCLLYGDCVQACPFDALHMTDQGPAVDLEKCTSCGLCVKACPRDIIEIIPLKKKTHIVSCISTEKGGRVRKQCKVGCIGCGLCVKACKFDAIKVEDNLAVIDQEKCKMCQACVKACPQNTIDIVEDPSKKKKVVVTPKQEVGCGACQACK